MSDKSRFLITTADECSWRTDRPVLFLGEWCRSHEKRRIWENMDAEVAQPYGWKNGQRERDIVYVNNLCESLLVELCDLLNRHHGTRHPPRYWRILLGTWLHRFTAIIFNRWSALQFALENHPVSDTVVLGFPRERLIASDYLDFARLYRMDAWNHAMYARILEKWTPVHCSAISVTDLGESKDSFTPPPSITWRQHVKRFIAGKTKAITESLSRSTDAFLISTYLPLFQELKLQLSLGQIPVPRFPPPGPKAPPDLAVRDQLRLDSGGFTGFEKFIREIIAQQIPTAYLEGYASLLETTAGLPWPDKPRFIFTSNSFDSDEVFKAWTASKVEAGTPYIIGQHGSNYGTAQYAPSEVHEVATADRYLTWGWEDNNPKHYPVAALTVCGKTRGRWNPRGGLLLVERGGGHREEPWDEIPVFKEYLQNQFKFVGGVFEGIRKKTIVRLYSAHLYLNWSEEALWKEAIPDIRLDFGTEPIGKLINQNRLIVFSYNSTGILETLAWNIPTLFFWDPLHWPFRPSARPYFDHLKEAGIFHETPESITTKVNEIWDDVEKWWRQNEVQEARRVFCNRFSRTPRNPLRALREALLTASIKSTAHGESICEKTRESCK
jgi:putative transferase (TIGR04331 family)